MAHSKPGKRRVLCPKCTAVLSEPQTQIYECPICNTLLLAKDYGLGKTPGSGLHGGGSQDKDLISKAGSKPEKAELIITDQGQGKDAPQMSSEGIHETGMLEVRAVGNSSATSTSLNYEHTSMVSDIDGRAQEESNSENDKHQSTSVWKHGVDKNKGTDPDFSDAVKDVGCTDGSKSDVNIGCVFKEAKISDVNEADIMHANLIDDGNKAAGDNIGGSKNSRSNGNGKQTSNIGKYRLFDLSVFGIYNEETYNAIRRNTVAEQTRMGDDIDNIGTIDDKILSEPSIDLAQTAVSGPHDTKHQVNEDVAQMQRSANVPKLSATDTDGNRSGKGGNLEKVIPQNDADDRSLRALETTVENIHAVLSSMDVDALAEARYGNIPSITELNIDPAHAEMSFGDWHVQHVTRPTNEDRILHSETNGDTDSSWDDDDEAKDDFKFKETLTKENAQGSSSMRERNDGLKMRIPSRKSEFPLRTTAMQKFLRRNDKQTAVQRETSKQPDEINSVLHEAPYEEHSKRSSQRIPQESPDQSLKVKVEDDANSIAYTRGGNAFMDTLEEADQQMTELQNEVPADILFPSTSRDAMPLTPVLVKADDEGIAVTDDEYSKEEAESTRSSQSCSTGQKVDKMESEAVALASAKADYVSLWNASGKPVSLRWKGKRSTQSISSTEDEGAYGAESEVGSGSEREPFKGNQIGRHLPDKEGTFLGRQPLYPSSKLPQRSANLQKPSSTGIATSRRTTRTRTSMDGIDVHNMERGRHNSGRLIPGDRLSGHLGLGRGPDQRHNHSDSGGVDYNSDHSSVSQDSQLYPVYVSNPYASTSGASPQAVYPLQVTSHGSVPMALMQDQSIPLHSHGHHCVSPACSFCIQHQYLMQQPQMLNNAVVHPCAVCAAKASAAAYSPMLHHEVHDHHMHGLIHANSAVSNVGILPAQSQRQHTPTKQLRYPVSLPKKKKKLYTPLPGVGAPPYVLCTECNQLLQVPEYLPPITGSSLKLRCGACQKASKFSFTYAENENTSLTMSSSMNMAIRNGFKDVSIGYLSDQGLPSGGLASVQSSHGKGSILDQHTHHRALSNDQASLHPNVFEMPSPRAESAGLQHQLRPIAGSAKSEQALYSSNARYKNDGTNDGYSPKDSGLYGEDYFFSSRSSLSGTSPRRLSQISREKQQGHPLVLGRPGFQDRKSGHDSTAYEDAGLPLESTSAFGPFQEGSSRGRRFSSSSQGSSHHSNNGSPYNSHMESSDLDSKASNWHYQSADMGHLNCTQQGQRMPLAPGAPLIEHISHDIADKPSLGVYYDQSYNPDDGTGSAPLSPISDSRQFLDPIAQHSPPSPSSVKSSESGHSQPLSHDLNKGPKSIAGLLKKSLRDLGRGQGGSRRRVMVNGCLIPEAAVQMAEKLAGPVHAGTYWYDYQAGFWGVMGGPCLGIVMPHIEEFNFPMPTNCTGGKTGIFVNGRELHERDLEVLARRGLPTDSGKAYIVDVSGTVVDEDSGRPLKGLGKLAPTYVMLY
ncbi:hypothetical protein KP509_13G064100 [Ceratopteris richardii]|uniref:Probable zinc-ribbon domain-containing protein n=1 Tax=Ceratopteris richardii TaxID=49495 RepID=A0A8T2TG94_CERRI|nr:hypothetical protein KP509_13G064100 [Ceratopteris richardii]